MWIYENHMGGLYYSEWQKDFDELYCETCGDSDMEIGYAETREEARELIFDYRNDWEEEYVEKFLNEMFEEDEE